MKRILMNGILALVFLIVTVNIFILLDDENSTNFNSYTTTYESQYPTSNYVDEQLNGNAVMHNLVMSALLNSNDFLAESDLGSKTDSILHTITNKIDFDTYIKDKQYEGTCNVEAVQQRVETYETNMYYTGCLSDGTIVKGNMSVYDEKNEYIFILSFVDDDGNFDLNKLKLLADDSNAEKITYDVIKYLQYVEKTNMTPDVASQYFFNGTIEQIAGSISYHAAIALYLFEHNLNNELTLERIEQVNISTNDFDAIIVNRSY